VLKLGRKTTSCATSRVIAACLSISSSTSARRRPAAPGVLSAAACARNPRICSSARRSVRSCAAASAPPVEEPPAARSCANWFPAWLTAFRGVASAASIRPIRVTYAETASRCEEPPHPPAASVTAAAKIAAAGLGPALNAPLT
jgi:hypothetical protein